MAEQPKFIVGRVAGLVGIAILMLFLCGYMTLIALSDMAVNLKIGMIGLGLVAMLLLVKGVVFNLKRK